MRPLYESEEDLNEEGKIITDLCAAWDCDYYKLPISYRLDFLLETKDKHPLGFVECKRRDFHWNQYPDIMISLSKVITAMNLGVATGRTLNTRDSADIEPVVHIPVGEFSEVKWKFREVN